MEVVPVNIFFPLYDGYHALLETINERVNQAVAAFFDLIVSNLFISISALFLGSIISSYVLPSSLVGKIASVFFSLGFPAFAAIGTQLFNKTKDEYREMKIHQIIESSNSNEKKGLIIETSDWSGGNRSLAYRISNFFVGNFRLLSYLFNIQKITKTHRVSHILAQSEEQIIQELDRLESLDFVWVRGHGESNGVWLSDDFCWHTEGSHRLMEKLGQKVTHGAKIIISSCETGVGEQNFARVLSQYCFRARVYAPHGNINSLMGTSLNDDLSVRFARSPCESLATVEYKSGRKIKPELVLSNLDFEFV